MVTLYTVLLTLHILAVVAWLGASIVQSVLAVRLANRREVFLEQLSWFGRKWFPAASGIAALTGIGLWIDGPWDLGEPWILIAVGGWIASSVIGATQLGPRTERLAERDDPAEFAGLMRFARVDTALLVLIVADMVIKPGV